MSEERWHGWWWLVLILGWWPVSLEAQEYVWRGRFSVELPQGWKVMEHDLSVMGVSKVLLLSEEPHDTSPKMAWIFVSMSSLEADPELISTQSLLLSYLNAFFFKLSARPQEMMPWECVAAATNVQATRGLKGVLALAEGKGEVYACQLWDAKTGDLLVALYWTATADTRDRRSVFEQTLRQSALLER